MNQLLSTSFWFDVRPLPFATLYLWIFIGILAAAIIFGFACVYIRAKKSGPLAWKVWSKLVHWAFSFGLVGLILVFFKEERIIYLGMRVWLILWGLISLLWLGFVLKFILVETPKIKEEKRRKEEIKKYLP